MKTILLVGSLLGLLLVSGCAGMRAQGVSPENASLLQDSRGQLTSQPVGSTDYRDILASPGLF